VVVVLAAGQGVGQAFLAPDVVNAVLGESVFLAERDAPEAFVALRPAVDYRGGRDHVRDSVQVVVERSEPLKWHTKLDTVSGKGSHSEEKEILPEISANGRRTDGDLRRCR
jgi:hypothetical protein